MGRIMKRAHRWASTVLLLWRRFRDEAEEEVNKGVWGMPRLSEAKKDVISCEKLRGSANRT